MPVGTPVVGLYPKVYAPWAIVIPVSWPEVAP